MNSIEDIKRAVDAYIFTANTPYAIMIDGDWGCGKTYLWKQILLPQIGEKEALYVSLFGLKNTRDIEGEIFKSMSFLSEKEGGVIQGLLKKSKIDISEDVSIGGIGFVAQYAMQKWKETRLNKSKKLFICFDDLERWGGNIEECLAYINKLTEHNGTKCLIIGNSKKLRKECKSNFEKTQDKTVGFTYQLTLDPNDVIDAALKLTNFSSKNSEKIITQICTENKTRINELLYESKCFNIRIVATGISYLDQIVEKNQSKFRLPNAAPIEYFLALLSMVVLLGMYLTLDEHKKEILGSSIGNSDVILEKLGVVNFIKTGKRQEQSEENRIIERLYFQCFTGIISVKRKGICSIVKNGFYREEDFEGEFSGWRKMKDFEIYLDIPKFHSMENEEAKRIFDNTYETIFNKKIVKGPQTLLSIAGRMTHDIKRGVLDLDFETVKNNFRKLFEEFYRTEEMALGCDLDFSWQTERMEYCSDLCDEVGQMNKEYNEKKQKFELSQFWVKLKNNPETLDDLLRRYKTFDIFSQHEDPKDVLNSIEVLNNAQLMDFARWMGSEVFQKNPLPSGNQNFKRAQLVVLVIKQKYTKKFGVRAGHFKQIARVLENQKTEYDLEYLQREKGSLKGSA